MLYPIIDDILIMMITAGCFFTTNNLWVLLITASLLMIVMTYISFSEEKPSKKETIFQVAEMMLFAISSGSLFGCLVFALIRQWKGIYRVAAAGITFCLLSAIDSSEKSFAQYLIRLLILVAGLVVLIMIFHTIQMIQKKNRSAMEKITISNIGELHEKRMNEQLMLQNVMAEKNARLIERENISRNIHNSVGHSITAAIMALDAADVLYDVKPEEARKRMNDANDRIRGSLDSIRRAVRVLDENTEKINFGDLKFEMQTIIHEFVMDTSIRVSENYRDLPEEAMISHEQAEFLTGALKEFLTNGVKHGNADEFLVAMIGDTAHIRMIVSDNGKSDFDDTNRLVRIEQGFGLKKIISYVEKQGGKAEFTYDNGFLSGIELPLL